MTTLGALRASARGIGYLVRRGDVSGGEWLVGKGLNEKSVLGYPTVGRELSPCVGKSRSYLSCHHTPCALTVHDPRGNPPATSIRW